MLEAERRLRLDYLITRNLPLSMPSTSPQERKFNKVTPTPPNSRGMAAESRYTYKISLFSSSSVAFLVYFTSFASSDGAEAVLSASEQSLEMGEEESLERTSVDSCAESEELEPIVNQPSPRKGLKRKPTAVKVTEVGRRICDNRIS